MPQELKDLQQDVRTETNDLHNFLVHGDTYYDILFQEGSTTQLSAFQKAFKNHMQFHLDKKYKWTTDYFPFKSMGYKIQETNMCKSCDKPAQSGCCVDYNVKNRKKLIVIHNMKIRDKKKPYFATNQIKQNESVM